jgi:hypothetical protein
MPYKVFQIGEEALAADVNNYLAEQSVARFTNATQRTSQLVAPETNQLSMVDTRPGVVQYWTGSAWADVGPFIQYGAHSGTTDANGNCPACTYPVPFASTAYCFFTSYMNSGHQIVIGYAEAVRFTAKIFAPGGAAAANFAFQFFWLAIGTRVAAT